MRSANVPVGLLVLGLAQCLFSVTYASEARRAPPQPERYGDNLNVPGVFDSFQAVCDARREYIGWEHPLVFEQTTDHSGECWDRARFTPGLLGYPMRGNPGCPPPYRMRNFTDARAASSTPELNLFFGPEQYCGATSLDFYRDRPQTCEASFGNPIDVLTGVKALDVAIGVLNGFELSIHYDTSPRLPRNDADAHFTADTGGLLGSLWNTSFHRERVAQPGALQAHQGRGRWSTLMWAGTKYVAMDGKGAEYKDSLYWDRVAGELEQDERSRWRIGGPSISYVIEPYTPPSGSSKWLLAELRDPFGRAYKITYEAGVERPVRIGQITDPSGRPTVFLYDPAGNLTKIVWPDGSARQFRYEDLRHPWALTGVIDEEGHRVATYGYDEGGRSNSTEGGAGSNRYAVSWSSPPRWEVEESLQLNYVTRDHRWVPGSGSVTLPDGTLTEVTGVDVGGTPRLGARSQPAGSGCDAAVQSKTYDESGNVTQLDDFLGNRQCMTYDTGRNLLRARVEGLTTADSCEQVTAWSTLPAGARRITREWHPQWNEVVKQAEPGRLLTKIYNGQRDPFTGTVANCASAALLPDVTPLVVLCKQVEQPTLDADGSLGFAAPLQPGAPTRVTSWTYNRHGQVLTVKGPRTDIDDTTTYTYYTSTTADYTAGDLAQVANPAGQVTRFPRYNAQGQLLQRVDPNGQATNYTYDLRQRLTSTSVSGRTMRFDWFLNGLLKQVTQPDGSYVAYEYDDAQRLVGAHDHLNRRIAYDLDNAGNRTGERVQDPAGALRRQLARVMDALGRVQQTTGRE